MVSQSSNSKEPSILFLYRFNACRGNAAEDRIPIRLAHGLIARSQKLDPRSLQTKASSTALPAKLIDVGLDSNQSPRLVDTAGQTVTYVALSYCWGPRTSSETQLTISNMGRLERGIESTEIPRCALDAINFTRSLGVRYIWIDSLCVVQDDHEGLGKALTRIAAIYHSAVVTIAAIDAAIGTNDETVECCIDSSVLQQPFSIFLDWSRPTVAHSFSDRLLTPNTLSRGWIFQARILFGKSLIFYTRRAECKKAARRIVEATHINESEHPQGKIPDSDRPHDTTVTHVDTESIEVQFEGAFREIDQGIKHSESGRYLQALISFVKARESISAFQILTPRSWRMHAIASANIALVYQMQRLPGTALDTAEASLAMQRRLPEGECDSSFE